MARWDIYNIVGDASHLLEYEVECRDWDWEDNVDPTSDVGLAFSTVVRALSEAEQGWTDELFELLGDNGGGRILKYEGSSVGGSVVCRDLEIAQDGEVETSNQWRGQIADVYRVDENTVFDRAKHDWTDVRHDLTIKSIPYSLRNVDGSRDPDPRFHLPLMRVVEEDTGLQTVYQGHWGHGWRTAGNLPGCVYNLKEIADHIEQG